MNVNLNLQNTVWGGTIPLHITLHDSDLTDISPPAPIMMEVSRTCLWSHVLAEVYSHFGPKSMSVIQPASATPVTGVCGGVKTKEVPSQIWLESGDGYIINWTIPVGLTVDIWHRMSANFSLKNSNETTSVKEITSLAGAGLKTESSVAFPVHLVAHFSKYPSAVVPVHSIVTPDINSMEDDLSNSVITNLTSTLAAPVPASSSNPTSSTTHTTVKPNANLNVTPNDSESNPVSPSSQSPAPPLSMITQYTHIHAPPSALRAVTLSSLRAAASVLYGSSTSAVGLLNQDIEGLVDYVYHHSPCALSTLNNTLLSLHSHSESVVFGGRQGDFNGWRKCVQSLDADAYAQWTRRTRRRLTEIESVTGAKPIGVDEGNPESAGEEGSMDMESFLDEDNTPANTDGESADNITPSTEVSMETLLVQRDVLHKELSTVYTTFTETSGPHMVNIPLKLFNTLNPVPLLKQDKDETALLVELTSWANSRQAHGVSLHNPDGSIHTLGSLLNKLMPNYHYYNASDKTLTGKTCVVAVAHGIELPFDMPVDWAYSHFRHPDLFLYLVIAAK